MTRRERLRAQANKVAPYFLPLSQTDLRALLAFADAVVVYRDKVKSEVPIRMISTKALDIIIATLDQDEKEAGR